MLNPVWKSSSCLNKKKLFGDVLFTCLLWVVRKYKTEEKKKEENKKEGKPKANGMQKTTLSQFFFNIEEGK